MMLKVVMIARCAVFLPLVMCLDLSAKVALILGITGQDGSYLTEFLLEKGYEVHGIKRRSSSFNTSRIDHVYKDPHERVSGRGLVLHYGDITDAANMIYLIAKIKPDEIYNLAAQSHVLVSFELPYYTAQVDGLGTLNVLEAIRSLGWEHQVKFYQASTSELYGKVQEIPQSELTPFYPRSPYGVAKLYGFWITKNYREAYGMFACNGILFNHESPRRGETFVTRKITRAVARIALGYDEILYLGNLDARRDWGHARDYIEAMWLMLQQDEPDDFVIASGHMHSVREFVQCAFHEIGITIAWRGSGLEEEGCDAKTGKVWVKIDPRYLRPSEVELLIGNASKARDILGWEPKISFCELVQEMVACDRELLHTEPRMRSAQ